MSASHRSLIGVTVPFAPADDACDPLLHPYRNASDADAEELRNALVRDEALPVIRAVARSRFHGEPEEIEEVSNDAVVQVLRRLGSLREAAASSIASFRGYVATVAHRLCDARLRERYPERHRLNNRIRYVLSHRPEFFLDETRDGWCCGLEEHRGWPLVRELPDLAPRGSALRGAALVETLRQTFESAGGPVRCDELVSRLSRGLDARPVLVNEASIGGAERVPGLERLSELRRLWNEVVSLPRPQRVALLLHLRGIDGEELLSILPLTGIATIEEIASVLEISPAALADAWNELPFPDVRIGEMLGLSRQQVINLRKSARERLMRRLRT